VIIISLAGSAIPIIHIHNVLIALLLPLGSLLLAKPTFTATTSASEYRELGLRYRQQERFPEAIAALEKSVELDPQNTSSRVVLGWTLYLASQEPYEYGYPLLKKYGYPGVFPIYTPKMGDIQERSQEDALIPFLLFLRKINR